MCGVFGEAWENRSIIWLALWRILNEDNLGLAKVRLGKVRLSSCIHEWHLSFLCCSATLPQSHSLAPGSSSPVGFIQYGRVAFVREIYHRRKKQSSAVSSEKEPPTKNLSNAKEALAWGWWISFADSNTSLLPLICLTVYKRPSINHELFHCALYAHRQMNPVLLLRI